MLDMLSRFVAVLKQLWAPVRRFRSRPSVALYATTHDRYVGGEYEGWSLEVSAHWDGGGPPDEVELTLSYMGQDGKLFGFPSVDSWGDQGTQGGARAETGLENRSVQAEVKGVFIEDNIHVKSATEELRPHFVTVATAEWTWEEDGQPQHDETTELILLNLDEKEMVSWFRHPRLYLRARWAVGRGGPPSKGLGRKL